MKIAEYSAGHELLVNALLADLDIHAVTEQLLLVPRPPTTVGLAPLQYWQLAVCRLPTKPALSDRP
jgi:hypothetical protein